MPKKIVDPTDLKNHALRRDKKLRKQHHLTDNRKSIRLIARLSSTLKHGKKPSPR